MPLKVHELTIRSEVAQSGNNNKQQQTSPSAWHGSSTSASQQDTQQNHSPSEAYERLIAELLQDRQER